MNTKKYIFQNPEVRNLKLQTLTNRHQFHNALITEKKRRC